VTALTLTAVSFNNKVFNKIAKIRGLSPLYIYNPFRVATSALNMHDLGPFIIWSHVDHRTFRPCKFQGGGGRALK